MQHVLAQSKKLFNKASKSLVGGVNSPVRSFKSVGGGMVFAKKAKGAYLWDADGNKYIDYIMNWGVSILGHAYRPVIDAAKEAINRGSSFGLSTEYELNLANTIKRHFKTIDKIRFVTSGTEACMSAVRLARAFTERSKVIKFDGCYHGHFDSLLVKSGSGNLTFGIPSGEGILKTYTEDTISIPFNDKNILQEVIKRNRGNIACVIVEPVLCNTGVILPKGDFLKFLEQITKKEGILLIFDEVITGFRLSLGGAQKLFGIKPDLTCLGKIIGGGFPVGAYGGRKDIMSLLAPEGEVYQAGTLSGNPVTVAAGIKVLEELERDRSLYSELEQKTDYLVSMIEKGAQKKDIPIRVNKIGSIFSVFFIDKLVENHGNALSADKKKYAGFFNYIFKHRILFPPSPFEASFLSRAHSAADIEKTVEVFLKWLSGAG
jgi:glutamate-1-semialdehyde 2,1-aminomutase